MFERFTERARQIVVLAQDEARRLGHDEISMNDLLIGILNEEEGLAARVLNNLDITVTDVRRTLDAYPTNTYVVSGQVPFASQTKAVLEQALRTALSLGHNYIGTEHILLAMVLQGGDSLTDGAKTLQDLGVHPTTIRTEILRLLDRPGKKQPPTIVEETPKPPAEVSRVSTPKGYVLTDQTAVAVFEGLKLIADAIRKGNK